MPLLQLVALLVLPQPVSPQKLLAAEYFPASQLPTAAMQVPVVQG